MASDLSSTAIVKAFGRINSSNLKGHIAKIPSPFTKNAKKEAKVIVEVSLGGDLPQDIKKLPISLQNVKNVYIQVLVELIGILAMLI